MNKERLKKQDPLKEIRAIKASLRQPGKLMLDLRADKLAKYLEYRQHQLVERRIALLPRELRYLLTETGPGPLRFDPVILDALTQNTIMVSENTSNNERQKKEVIALKQAVEDYLDDALKRPELQERIKDCLEEPLGSLVIESRDPLILRGDLGGRSVILFFYNNQWLMPDSQLINDLKYAYHQNAYPVFIAKKIHGVLFPYFKAMGVQGFNIYSALLTNADLEKYKKLDGRLRVYEEASYYTRIKSNYQARVGSVDLLSEHGGPISQFLEKIPIQVSISEFHSLFKTSKHSFGGQIGTLGTKKTRQALLKTVEKRTLMMTRLIRKLQH